MTDNRQELSTTMFGREVTFSYSETWIGYSLLSLRVVMAWIFFQAGIQKFLDPSWSASGFLQGTTLDPLGMFTMMSGEPIVDALVIYGQLAIGLGLFTGTLVRLASFGGGLMMVLFWLGSLEGGLMAGLPIEHGYVVSSHIVYLLLLFGIGSFGAGRILGIDAWIEDQAWFEDHPWLRYLTG
ncbi:MAG: DoxX family protein [Candidatus Nanohaloarchaeota archaeon QJJ-5]|nr:DoxX family protein [Candidatus Nanohaloarchaeota archaeon QJJ-5]